MLLELRNSHTYKYQGKPAVRVGKTNVQYLNGISCDWLHVLHMYILSPLNPSLLILIHSLKAHSLPLQLLLHDPKSHIQHVHLLLHMRPFEPRRHARTRVPARIHHMFSIMMFRLIQQSLDPRLREAPSPRIQRLFLRPHDRLRIGVLV